MYDTQLMLLEQLCFVNEDVYKKLGITTGFDNEGVLDTITSLSDAQIDNLANSYGDVEINNLTGKEWADIFHAIQNDKDIKTLKSVGYNEKVHAFCYEQLSGKAIVAFQGTTGSEEWIDNGKGFYQSDTEYQKQALEYINGLDYDKITVVGHSKGGNKAQYVTLLSDKVDHCVSMDGQGFSPEFYKQHTDQVKNNAAKIFSYSARNDFVHILMEPVPGSEQNICTQGKSDDKTGTEGHDPNGMFKINPSDYSVTCISDSKEEKNKGLKLAGDYGRFALNNMPYNDRVLVGSFVGNIMAIACTKGGYTVNGIHYTKDSIINYVLSNKKETGLLLAYLMKYVQLYGVSAEELEEMLNTFGMKDADKLAKAICSAAAMLGSEPGISYPALLALLKRTGLELLLSQYKDVIVSSMDSYRNIKIGWDNTNRDNNTTSGNGSRKRIKIDTELLIQQSSELSSLCKEFESSFNTIDALITKSHSHLSSTIVSNIYVKTTGLKRNMKKLSALLSTGAKASEKASISFSSVDSELSKLINGSEDTSGRKDKETDSVLALDNYFSNVSDAEYAKLCSIWGKVSNGTDPEKAFIDGLKELPENDPLRKISVDQMQTFLSPSGLAALSIADGRGNALVLFAGTQNGDMGDIAADINLAVGTSSIQSKEANRIIDMISRDNHNIQVTGHSLGGYLATSVTLNNSTVTRCIAFDPPGRNDVLWQGITNSKQASKVTTYEARGSVVSAVGSPVGNYIPIKVKESGHYYNLTKNHSINNIYEALGGYSEVSSSWGA